MPKPSTLPWRRPPALAWGRYPLLPLVLAMMLGIALAKWNGYRSVNTAFVLLVSVVIIGFFWSWRKAASRLARHLLAIPILLAFIGFGYWRTAGTDPLHQADHFGHQLREDGLYEARILELRPGTNRLRARVEVEASVLNDQRIRSRGQALVYFPPNSATVRLGTGDRILLQAELSPIRPALNPGGFDFQAYWANQYIYHQTFLRDDNEWHLLARGRPSIGDRAAYLRESWIDRFRPHLAPDELAVAAALVLGKRDLISDELRSAYADTGAVHVLAVSGLHVGIVASILLWLFRRLLPGRSGPWRWLRMLFCVAGIWGFALLTGFSPSVQRAALMFSVLLFGVERRRRSPLFNSLAAAALAILLYDPRQLFAVGFQLSFAAVAGIGLFQRPIASLWRPSSRVLRPVWSILSVSLAAQLGTLPLVMYYFQQFPLYFLLSGSIVILTAYGGLILGLLHGLLAWLIPAAAGVSGALLNVDLSVQNAVVRLCRQLPGAAQQLDPIGLWQVFVLYGLILGFAAWLRWRRFWLAVSLLFGLLILGLFRLTQVGHTQAAAGVAVFHQYDHSLVEVRRGRAGIAIQSVGLTTEKRGFLSDGFRKQTRYQVDSSSVVTFGELAADSISWLAGRVQGSGAFLRLHEHNWLLLSGRLYPPAETLRPEGQARQPNTARATDPDTYRGRQSYSQSSLQDLFDSGLTIDRVLIRAGARTDQLPADWPWPETVFVIDGSNRRWQVRAWREWANERGLFFHYTGEQGAWIEE